MDKLSQLDRIEYSIRLNGIEQRFNQKLIVISTFLIILFVAEIWFVGLLSLIAEIVIGVKALKEYRESLSKLNNDFFEVKPRGKHGR